jgi:hypothetical protein
MAVAVKAAAAGAPRYLDRTGATRNGDTASASDSSTQLQHPRNIDIDYVVSDAQQALETKNERH